MEQETEFQPEKQMTIKDLETLRLISDSLKLQIVDSVCEKAKTVKQIAKELETTTTKLYYHIGPLEEHGLIKVASTRVVSGIIEKQYRAAARSFLISRSLLTLTGADDVEAINQALQGNALLSIDLVRREVEASFRAGLLLNHLTQARIYLTKERAEELSKRLESLVQEFDLLEAEDAEQAGAEKYSLVLALYPLLADTVDEEVSA